MQRILKCWSQHVSQAHLWQHSFVMTSNKYVGKTTNNFTSIINNDKWQFSKSRCNVTFVIYTDQNKIFLHKNLIILTHWHPAAEAHLFPMVPLSPQVNKPLHVVAGP